MSVCSKRLAEFFEVDVAVPVDVGLFAQPLELLVVEVPALLLQLRPQLADVDGAAAVGIELLEQRLQLSFPGDTMVNIIYLVS